MSSYGVNRSKTREETIGRLPKLFVLCLTAAILMLASFGVGITVGAGVNAAPLSAVPSDPESAAEFRSDRSAAESSATVTDTVLDEALFQEAWEILQDQFFGDLPEGEEITYEAIRGVVDSLGDPNTAFVDPQHAALFQSDMQGHFEGIGARVALAEGGGVLLTYLFPDQPAERAGLRVGDVIVAVDGQDITDLPLLDAISLIRGPKDSQVLLTVRREDGSVVDIQVTRARIEIPTVEARTLADGRIRYIALSEFSAVAPVRLAEAMREAMAANPEGLILDLRGNPGGLLDASVEIASYFVPSGNILIERFKNGDERIYRRKGPFLLGDTPLVVLVDGGSASASEIVAGAIQDAGTGVLIGERTYGKGSVQLPNTLSDGSQLRVTIAHWFTPAGREIHGDGLGPDIVVPFTEEDAAANSDPQLDRAVEYLLAGQVRIPGDTN